VSTESSAKCFVGSEGERDSLPSREATFRDHAPAGGFCKPRISPISISKRSALERAAEMTVLQRVQK
jgi:hypothetical protein